MANPGPMRTKEKLTENDKDFENLYGTSGDMGVGYEPDYLDAYIDPKYTAHSKIYFIYGQDLFNFLHSRYGGNIVKRFYIRKGNSFYTQVETHLQAQRVIYLNSNMMLANQMTESMLKKWWT